MSLFKRKKTNFVIKKTDGHGLLCRMYNTGNFKTYCACCQRILEENQSNIKTENLPQFLNLLTLIYTLIIKLRPYQSLLLYSLFIHEPTHFYLQNCF